MLTCKEAAYIISESLDGQLPWRKRFRVRVHLSICKGCRRMVRQMGLLRNAARRYGSIEEKEFSTEREALSVEARARILTRLQLMKSDFTGHE